MSEVSASDGRPVRRSGFFSARWRGLVPMQRLFLLDTIVVGTLVNIATTLAAVLLLGADVPEWLALAVHFSPLPYNFFLFLAVWRTSEINRVPLAWALQIMAAFWLIAVTVA